MMAQTDLDADIGLLITKTHHVVLFPLTPNGNCLSAVVQIFQFVAV